MMTVDDPSSESTQKDQVPAFRVEFNLCEMFPSDDPLSVPLLRLLAAVNDGRYLQGQLIALNEDLERGTELDTRIRQGQFFYVIRMLGAHLYESGKAFREMHATCRRRVESLLGPDTTSQGRRALAAVTLIFDDSTDQGFNKAVLQRIRTLWAFHCKAERFLEAREGVQNDDTEMVACRSHGLGPYTFVDSLVSEYSLEQVCTPFGGVTEVVKRLIRLTGDLATASDSIVAALFEEKRRAGARMDWNEGAVTIPPVMQARLAGIFGDERQIPPRGTSP